MEIHKDTWHYRITSSFFSHITYRQTTLCKYFWMTIVSLIATSVGVIALLIAVGIMFAGFLTNDIDLVISSSFLWVVLGMIVFCTAREASKEFKSPLFKEIHLLPKRIKPPQKINSFASVVIKYIKAAKQRVCPLIDFVE